MMLWLTAGFTTCMFIYAIYVVRSAWLFSRIPCERPLQTPVPPRVSIIVPARNEAEKLSACLSSLFNQSYDPERYEVILVDDHSTDGTLRIAWLFAEMYPNLHIIPLRNPEKVKSPKKEAIQAGIDRASGDIILQMDADCEVGSFWIEAMVSHFGPNTAMVAGPISLRQDGSLFQRLQAMESMGLVALGAGGMAARRPTTLNAANMGYLRQVFNEVDGFEGIDKVASGDDELLMQKINGLKKYEIRFVRCRAAIVETDAEANWQALKQQRLRWVSKARYYIDRRPNIIQAISYLAFLGIPVLLIAGLWNIGFAAIGIQLFLLKMVADAFIMYASGRFFHRMHWLPYLPLLELVYIPYVLWIGVAGNLVKQYSWKDRTVS